jgi:hypothetical protein
MNEKKRPITGFCAKNNSESGHRRLIGAKLASYNESMIILVVAQTNAYIEYFTYLRPDAIRSFEVTLVSSFLIPYGMGIDGEGGGEEEEKGVLRRPDNTHDRRRSSLKGGTNVRVHPCRIHHC